MSPFRRLLVPVIFAVAATGAQAAPVGIKITEWMYNGVTTPGNIGEFVELTNFGPTAVNFTGWSFDDNSRTPGSQSLSAFGLVNSGESVILTDMTEAAFRSAWSLAPTVKVIGGNVNNLGRADEINIYDNLNNLIDRLTYDDQTLGSPRTQFRSAVPGSLAAVGANNSSAWFLSAAGDGLGSYTATTLDVGSPGYSPYAPAAAPVPLPGALGLLAAGLGLIGVPLRRRRDAHSA